MAVIMPFQAVRPAGDKAGQVSSLAFDTYSEEEMNLILDNNPYSFLQILTAGYLPGKKVSTTNRFRKVRQQFINFKHRGILVKDEEPALYIYELQRDTDYFLGFFGATSCEDYSNNIIRRHEDTIARREQIFASFLKEVHFNAEPVLLMYPDSREINAILEQQLLKKPACDFETPDRYRHRLWPVFDPEILEKIQLVFNKIDTLYIADGHHRTASSSLLARESMASGKSHTGQEAYNYFMSYLLPESAIKVSQYNRMVRDLNGHTLQTFLEALSANYVLKKMGKTPWEAREKHQFSMYLEGDFYSLSLKPQNWKRTDALGSLDSYILFHTVLQPVLGIEDLRNSKRLRYGVGRGSLERMKLQIDRGEFAVGFGMVPITVEEIKAVADAGQVMPPKSTYIEPKLRSGLAFYEF